MTRAKPLLKSLPLKKKAVEANDPLKLTPEPIKPPKTTGAGRNPSSLPLGPAPRGRPVSNIGQYLIRPTNETLTGYEMLNDKPDMLNQVHDRYLKAYQLPPALQPKYLRKPEVMEQGTLGRAKNISRGWRKPRSQQG